MSELQLKIWNWSFFNENFLRIFASAKSWDFFAQVQLEDRRWIKKFHLQFAADNILLIAIIIAF